MRDNIEIQTTDFWVKVVGMLQQNWALAEDTGSTTVYFITDTSGIFDTLTFETMKEAEGALKRNGFRHFAQCPDLQSFLQPPSAPFHKTDHPNGPIYSSGQFWLP